MTKDEMQATVQKADASVLTGLIDGFFAGLEARAAGKPIVLGLLKGANTIIDMVLTTYGLALLLALLVVSAATAQGLPRARDTIEVSLPRARDYIEVATVAQVEPPCKNCDCGCPESPCSCDKPNSPITQTVKGEAALTSVIPCDAHAAPAEATTLTSGEVGADQAGVIYQAPAQRFFRYRPVYQRGRSCSS